MINLYEGGLGSGKTYDAVRRLLDNLKNKRRILTNIDGLKEPEQLEMIKHLTNFTDFEISKYLIFLEPEQIPTFWDLTVPNDLIVIDEVHKYFNSRNWKSKGNTDFGIWASEHRHNGQDVLLIAPGAGKIESSVRDMAEWVYTYKKINMFGGLIQKKYIRFVSLPDDDKPLGKKICTYDPLIFKCYKSFFTDDAKEVGIEKNANILKHPIFIAIPILLVVFLYTFSNSSLVGKGVINKIKNPSKKVEIITPSPVPITHEETNSNGTDEGVKLNKKKIIGYVNNYKIMKSEKGISFE